jgi:hypothetical protein
MGAPLFYRLSSSLGQSLLKHFLFWREIPIRRTSPMELACGEHPLHVTFCQRKMPSDNELHKAANKGDLEECKKYIETPDPGEEPLDVNGPGAADRRPLHRAAGAGHLVICEYLVSKGALIDAVMRITYFINLIQLGR